MCIFQHVLFVGGIRRKNEGNYACIIIDNSDNNSIEVQKII
jgi:hypothetical protein